MIFASFQELLKLIVVQLDQIPVVLRIDCGARTFFWVVILILPLTVLNIREMGFAKLQYLLF